MPDAQVVSGSPLAAEISKKMTDAENMKRITFVDLRQDANLNRPPDYFLYIYNIEHRSFTVPRTGHGMITLRACPPGEPFCKVRSIPNIVQQLWPDADNGEIRARGLPGERFATDLLNPVNIGVDIWAEVTREDLTWVDGGSDDLTVRGLFWTRNDPPKDWELQKAKQRMEKFYRGKIEQARRYAQSDKTRDQIGDDHHFAASYFRIRESWHTVAELPALCPNCGEVLPMEGVAYHRNSLGDRCVLDWKRAVESGAIKYEDVPEGKRWGKKVA